MLQKLSDTCHCNLCGGSICKTTIARLLSIIHPIVVIHMCASRSALFLSIFQRWKKPNSFRLMHWAFGFNAKSSISTNKIMVLCWHSALGTTIGRHQVLCPIISTNSQKKIRIEPGFVGPQMIGFFKKKTMKNPTIKNRVVPTLVFWHVICGPIAHLH